MIREDDGNNIEKDWFTRGFNAGEKSGLRAGLFFGVVFGCLGVLLTWRLW